VYITHTTESRAGRYNPVEREEIMFFTLYFTNRERYCKAVRYLMANADKYNILNSGKDYGANFKAPKMDHGWYVYFSKRMRKG